MPNQVIAANTLTAGLRATFADTYKMQYEVIRSRLGNVMELGLASDKLTEIYGYFESAPPTRRWARGDTISADEFGSRQFSVTNLDWGIQVNWMEQDRQDDLTKSLLDRARDAGRSFAALPERVFFQILRGVVDNDLLPAIPTAPDGLAMYAANRFGLVAGNIAPGTGATTANVRTDFFTGVEQIRAFQDTQGQPLWPDAVLDGPGGWTCVYPLHMDQQFRECFIQSRTADNNAAVTNIITESGLKVNLWATQRLPAGNDDWYLFAPVPQKALFQQVRMPVRESFANFDNSDQVRQTKVEYVQWDSREGYGLTLPYQTVTINN